MRTRAIRRRVRRGLLGACAGCGALLIVSTAALAAGGPRVTSHHWQVAVSGRGYKVAAGGTFKYCPSDEVESIAPEVALTAARAGRYSYTHNLVGPHIAGVTPVSEVGWSGRRTVFDTAIGAVAFEGLSIVSGVDVQLIPGTYRFEMDAYGAPTHESRYEHKVKPTLVESVKLDSASSHKVSVNGVHC